MAQAITVEQLVELGGSEWQKSGKHRVYFNDLARWFGLDVAYYNTGNVMNATLNGEPISNSRAREILNTLRQARVWFDVTTGTFQSSGLTEAQAQTIIAAIEAAIPAEPVADEAADGSEHQTYTIRFDSDYVADDVALAIAQDIRRECYDGEDYDGSLTQPIFEWIKEGSFDDGEIVTLGTLVNEWKESHG